MDDSIDSSNFCVRGYLPLIQKDSHNQMHDLAVYVKEGIPFARDLSLENSADSYLCFRPSSSLCTIFYSISSNIDEVLSVNPSANVFVFGEFKVHHNDWLTYSGGTDRPVIIFLSQKTLSQVMVNFPFRIPEYDSDSPALLDFFLSFDTVIISTMLFLYWEILIMLSQFP